MGYISASKRLHQKRATTILKGQTRLSKEMYPCAFGPPLFPLLDRITCLQSRWNALRSEYGDVLDFIGENGERIFSETAVKTNIHDLELLASNRAGQSRLLAILDDLAWKHVMIFPQMFHTTST